MTRRDRAIEDAALLLKDRDEIGHDLIVEALTETGHLNVIDDYDWARLRSAIQRRHNEIRRIKRRAADARSRLQVEKS